jgi:hypothetical protein
VKRIEVRSVGLILRIPDSKKADDNARNGTCMEEHVTKLHNQIRAASANAVEQNGCGEKKINFQAKLIELRH